MKKAKTEVKLPDNSKSINGFTLANPDKLDRVINGVIGQGGKAVGGIGERFDDNGNLANGAEILAQYDRLGGLILKGGNKVKTGSFWDFEKKTKKEIPEVVFVFRDLEGDEVDVPEGEQVPLEVKAAQIAKEAKSKKLKKKSIEDEE